MKKLLIIFALLTLAACTPATPATPPTPPSATPPTTLAPPKDQTACTEEFAPVCGKIQVQCIKAPCPPIATTFQNKCEAEKVGATEITDGACVDKEPNPEGACLSFDGKWLSETQECEGMSKEQCEEMGGTFNECASACRNDPKAEVCTMQCVIVCQFAK